ncbi:2TM domain-containing protein [Aeromonas bivalvium]|uniref:2TM domain-containing protein n=1 Tax=Aeromonas bivalvium TaxID=440079 RepID=UPI0005A82220|nr:2TM domain-containing protein [Aeromonas bivalvium]
MIVRKLRLQRGWSQDQLATLSGLSVRTVQRIEGGQAPGLESLKALAAVFELDISQLQESEMSETKGAQGVAPDEREAMEFVQGLKGFYGHLISYGLVISLLWVINLVTSPGHIWAWWPMLGWGIGLGAHAFNLFKLPKWLGPDWERRQVERRLGRKL